MAPRRHRGQPDPDNEAAESASNSSETAMFSKNFFKYLAQRDETLLATLASTLAVRSPAMMPHAAAFIQQFNGEVSSSEAEQWLKSVDSTASINGWMDSIKLEAVRTQLTGAAKSWYSANHQEITTWTEFEARFRRTFVGETSTAERWDKMRNRLQSRDESAFAYFHDKVRLCKLLRLSFAEIKTQVLSGLRSHDQATILASRLHKDADELLADLRMAIELSQTRRNNFGKTAWKGSERISARENNEPTKSGDTGSTTVQHNSSKDNVSSKDNINNVDTVTPRPPRCFNCQGTGHYARQCTEPRRPPFCTLCKTEGHSRKFCTSGNSNATEGTKAVLFVDTGLVSGTAQKYCKIAEIEGEKFDAFVDTGASDCLIRASDAIRLKTKLKPCNVKLFGYGGDTEVNAENMACITVGIDGVLCKNICVFVVPDEAQPVSLLIGRTWTEQPNVTYTKVDNRFIIKSRELYTFPFDDAIVLEKSKSKVVRVREKRPIDENDMVFGPKFNIETRGKIVEIANEFRDAFALNIQELGCTDLVTMDIVEIPTSKPVHSKPYRTSAADRKITNKIVEEWKDAGLIRESSSEYASPAFLVGKKDGDKRLVVDYRRLNKQTADETFPLPDIDRQLEGLGGSKYFIILDLMNGFLQVPLTEQAKPKTAFVTEDCVYEFERAMFGLKNAPRVFAKLMYRVIGRLQNDQIAYFQDDILIAGKTTDEVCDNFKAVLGELQKANLTCKLTKCVFGCEQFEYLGFDITDKGISPSKRKVVAISNFQVPRDVHEVRRFLGLTGFFRRFVRKYAERSVALSSLTRKDVEFKWGTEQQAAFNDLVQALTASPVLALYDKNSETELHTDASSRGVSGMLLQRGKDGLFHLVYCVSKKLTQEEANYHSSKLELLAVIHSVNRLRQFLLNIKFTIVSDCQALVLLRTDRTKNPQIARWICLLQEFDYDFRHRAGERMKHVDAPSRAPVDEAHIDIETELTARTSVFLVTSSEEIEIASFQKLDEQVAKIVCKLQSKSENRNIRELRKKFEIKQGILFRVMPTERNIVRRLFVVPRAMRKSLAVRFHDLHGHFGTDRVVKKILENYWFPRMRPYIRLHINLCLKCTLYKKPSGPKPGYLNPIPAGKRPFEILHLDHVGPFPRSSRQNAYVLVAVDNLTKFVKLYPMRNTQTRHVLNSLSSMFQTFGLPERIISDRGTAFTSKSFENFCLERGIKHTLNAVQHPNANGQVERANRVLVPMIASYSKREDQRDWDVALDSIEKDMNAFHNKTTGVSPFEALYGYTPKHVDGDLQSITAIAENSVWTPPQELRQLILSRIDEGQQKMKEQYDKHRWRGVTYDIGEIVYISRVPTATGTSTKLQPKYRGPYVVCDKLPSDIYRVQELSPERGKGHNSTIHVANMKPWRPRDSHQEIDDNLELDSDSELICDEDVAVMQDGRM